MPSPVAIFSPAIPADLERADRVSRPGGPGLVSNAIRELGPVTGGDCPVRTEPAGPRRRDARWSPVAPLARCGRRSSTQRFAVNPRVHLFFGARYACEPLRPAHAVADRGIQSVLSSRRCRSTTVIRLGRRLSRQAGAARFVRARPADYPMWSPGGLAIGDSGSAVDRVMVRASEAAHENEPRLLCSVVTVGR